MQQVYALLAAVSNGDECLEHGDVLARIRTWPQSTWDSLSLASTEAPSNGNFLWLQGLCALESGCPKDAVEILCLAITQCPDHALALTALGQAMMDLGLPSAAIECFSLAINWNPCLAEPFFYRANALHRQSQWSGAIDDYRRAIVRRPTLMQAHNNLGLAFTRLGNHPLAIESLLCAVELDPQRAEPHCNLGVALYGAGKLGEAVESYDRALKLDPTYAEAANNRGNALWDLAYADPGLRGAALASYDLAITSKQDYAEAYWNKALALLQTGEYARGWPLYEWRWKRRAFDPIIRKFDCPLWLGEGSLKNKTILLHAEQGFGDAIQFCRYAALVQAQGAHVVLEVDTVLVSLLENLQGPEKIIAHGTALPKTDFHCPLLSLPLAFQTTLKNIPGRGTYLSPPFDKILHWRQRLGPKLAPRVGLVWRGDPTHRNDHNRSLLLKTLLPYLPTGYEYISLQKSVQENDLADLAARPDIHGLGEALSDFSETAAACFEMDVLITVDTSVAHLSASLGKPTWILLSAPSDWRWLLDRADSPWYDSARLFRQHMPGEWSGVLSDLQRALLEYLPLN